MTISTSSMLVELNISVWTANRVDRDASRKVTTDNGATADAGLFRKNLMAGSNIRKEIADYAASCRLWHNVRTLPWADRGARLLPTSLFFDYKTEANARKAYFDEKVTQFVKDYPTLVQTARQHLGAMFNPDDYPPVEEVQAKFGFRLVFSPVPESGDFRLDLPRQEMEEMQRQYDVAFNDRIADAMREPWSKLRDLIQRMSDKLTDDDLDTDAKKRWHDTFITNAQDMCQMLTHLNVTGDRDLEQARRELERAVAGVRIDDVKEDAYVRKGMKAKLDTILNSYEW